MSKTNSGLVAYAKEQVGKPYWYGCYGQTATAALLKSKKAQYPSYYTASDFESQIGQRVHDCSGLSKGYLWSTTNTSTPSYKSSQDLSAAKMYSTASTKGKIATFDKVAGRLLFKGSTASSISHVGIYGGDGYVYEAKGHAYGVQKTAYSASDWTFWAQHPDITDDTSESSTATTSSATSSTTTASSEVTASAKAQSYLKSLAGTYTVTASSGLNVRDGAGTHYDVLVAIPCGTAVTCYGYYTTYSGTKWLYVQFTYGGVKYTGFASSTYLAK